MLETHISDIVDQYFSEQEKAFLIDLRRDLHQIPELAFQEFETQKRIQKALTDIGIEDIQPVAGTGLIARIKGADAKSSTLCLRGDIDALPIQEATGLPFSSKHSGRMHACGHDVHASWVVAAGLLLQKQQLKGDVILLFQPAEEIAKGALEVIKSGVLDGVRAIFGGHVDRRYAVGQVVAHEGAIAANSDTFSIKIVGKGAHGARPAEGQSPFLAVSEIINMVHTFLDTILNKDELAVISIGSVQSGHTHNVIPGEAIIQGTIRSFLPDVRQKIHQQLKDNVRAIIVSHKLEGSCDILVGAPSIVNKEPCLILAQKAVENSLGVNALTPLNAINFGAEDFGYYLEDIPGCFLRIGARYKNGEFVPAHNEIFFVEDETIFVAGIVFSTILRLF